MSKKPTVAVVGGAGYIGAHICKELSMKGYTPVVIDNFITGHKDFVRWGTFFKCDICNKDELLKTFKEIKPIAVFHFAAFIEVAESMIAPEKYYVNNVLGTINVLSVMTTLNIKYFVFSSTAAVYGMPQQELIDETHPCLPLNPYGHSKLMMEQIIKDYACAYGINYLIFRYFNACGADLDTEIGEDHSPESHIIPNIFMAATKKRDYLTIFGNNYLTKDGTCVRDYIHVADLSNVHVLGLTYLLDKGKSSTLNLGTSKGITVFELFEFCKAFLDVDINYSFSAARQGDAPILVANANKVKDILNWTPHLSSLDIIIDSAWKWYCSRFS